MRTGDMSAETRSVSRLLDRAIRRVRRIGLVRGIATVGIVWILGVGAAMAVDSRFVIFDDRLRWAMTAGVWLLAVVAALLAVVRPLRRRLDRRRMAAILDNRHAEQEERLSTLVELSESDADKAGFSASLFALVCDLAEGDVSKLDLRREFPVSGAGRRLGVFALLALTLAVGSWVSPNLVGRLFVRALAPWSDIGNLFSDEIAVKPGDITILSGSVIRIEAKAKGACSIRISRKTTLGWSEETTEEMSGGVYETTADLNERDWRYRVTSGHAVTRYYHVHVSQMPRYDLFTATVDYPAYTRMRPLVLSNADVAAISAIQGSRVSFDVRVSDPGTLVDFRIDREAVFGHTMVSNHTASWSLDLVNADGFRAEKGRHPLTSFIDQPPTVLVEKPTGTLRLPPHAKIPVEITATDDVSVDELHLRVSIDNGPWARHANLRLESQVDRRLVRTVADVDLSLYDLIFAKNVRFDVVASDGCPPEFGGPHSATSTPFTVQFVADEASYEIQELRTKAEAVRRDLDEARRRLNDAQNLARQVREELRRDQDVSAATEEKGERLAHELEEAEKRIEELRDGFWTDERFAPLTRPLDRLLAETLKPALESVENSQFMDRNERADAVGDALPEIERALMELDDFSKRLAERADKVDAFEKAKDLAARQEALAKSAEELTRERPVDTAKLEAWKRLEEAAMRKADELARLDPESGFAEAKRKMETAAREMARLKEKLDAEKAGRQVTENRQEEDARFRELQNAVNDQKRAAAAVARKDFKQAAEAQRTVEDRLERGGATDGVRALQQLATTAVRNARKTPQTKEKSDLAESAQKAAAEALQDELKVREGIRKGEKTAADLAALDEKIKEKLLQAASERTAAAKAAAEAAIRKAKDVIGTEEDEQLASLATAALEAARDAVSAGISESKLRRDDARTDALRNEEYALDAITESAAENQAVEDSIRGLQQSVSEALARGDRNRAVNLQKDIARAQARAADSVNEENETEARTVANEAQAQAAEEIGRASREWNNETKVAAETAQKAAAESEKAAQAEARDIRALSKISAAEKAVASTSQDLGSSNSSALKPSVPQTLKPSEAAEAASDSMNREVNAQAAALGMSKRGTFTAARRGAEEEASGGVSEEVSELANDLRRNDSPTGLKSIFSRLGWFKIRGLSRDGLGTRDLSDVPREYRDLVRRYFLKLSEENP